MICTSNQSIMIQILFLKFLFLQKLIKSFESFSVQEPLFSIRLVFFLFFFTHFLIAPYISDKSPSASTFFISHNWVKRNLAFFSFSSGKSHPKASHARREGERPGSTAPRRLHCSVSGRGSRRYLEIVRCC